MFNYHIAGVSYLYILHKTFNYYTWTRKEKDNKKLKLHKNNKHHYYKYYNNLQLRRKKEEV